MAKPCTRRIFVRDPLAPQSAEARSTKATPLRRVRRGEDGTSCSLPDSPFKLMAHVGRECQYPSAGSTMLRSASPAA